LIADAAGTTVWRWDQAEPFGVNLPDQNPSALGAFEFPLRFPGQYADKEAGLFYNYHRNYAQDLGRYVESDPIGIRGGINVFAYVLDPMKQIDPLGLMGFGSGANYSGQRSGNGNISGGLSPQDMECTGDFGILDRNPCTKQCCVAHDDCFTQNNCNMSSWFGNIFIGSTFPCNKCNSDVVKCVMENRSKSDCNNSCKPNR
jgi:RHS repeat-associated protein